MLTGSGLLEEQGKEMVKCEHFASENIRLKLEETSPRLQGISKKLKVKSSTLATHVSIAHTIPLFTKDTDVMTLTVACWYVYQ